MRKLSDALEHDYNKLYPLSGLFENQNIKKYIKNYKDFQVLISFVKHWSKRRHIYGKAFGFLGGISWSLMVAFFLKNSSEKFQRIRQHLCNSARFEALLGEFFNFYSNWNWTQTISLVELDIVSEAFKKYGQQKSPMCILQSVYPYHNTSKNINDYNKKIIAHEIQRASQLLKNEADLAVVWSHLSKEIEFESILKTTKRYVLFRIEYNLENDLVHIFNLIKAKVLGLVTSLQRILLVDLRAYTDLFDESNISIEMKEHSSKNLKKSYLITVNEATSEQNSVKEFTQSQITAAITACNGFIQFIRTTSHTVSPEITLLEKLQYNSLI
jgi:poly(A) polymerase Pap1